MSGRRVTATPTEAQRKAMIQAAAHPLGRGVLADGRRGFRRSGWERMWNRIVDAGWAKYLAHVGEYELSAAGRAALKESTNDQR